MPQSLWRRCLSRAKRLPKVMLSSYKKKPMVIFWQSTVVSTFTISFVVMRILFEKWKMLLFHKQLRTSFWSNLGCFSVGDNGRCPHAHHFWGSRKHRFFLLLRRGSCGKTAPCGEQNGSRGKCCRQVRRTDWCSRFWRHNRRFPCCCACNYTFTAWNGWKQKATLKQWKGPLANGTPIFRTMLQLTFR